MVSRSGRPVRSIIADVWRPTHSGWSINNKIIRIVLAVLVIPSSPGTSRSPLNQRPLDMNQGDEAHILPSSSLRLKIGRAHV